MKKKTRKTIKIGSHLICFGLSLDLFYIFLCAYFNNGEVIVHINQYNEAQVELILIPLTLLFCLIGLFFAWRDIKK